jgi:glutamyl-Q tRNA(Asp) synthetase
MSSSTTYRGRFAPSPTGPLHFGSLIAALGSYLDAKHHHGSWLVRMEDLDVPRTVPGAADAILRTLERLGLQWDGEVIYQSKRTAAYDLAFQQLQTIAAIYPCACSRKEIADSALHGIEGQTYPGTCRSGIQSGREGRAWRVRTNNDAIEFEDGLQGSFTQHLESEIGDFVIKRADGLFSYQLAVVMDDAFQGVTHVVRGADLLTSTARQIHLQTLLGLPKIQYLHLPVAINTSGEKFSKQTLAKPVDLANVPRLLIQALRFLQQNPPAELSQEEAPAILQWSVLHWNRNTMNSVMRITHDS